MAQNSQTRQLQTLLDTYTYSTSDSVPAKTLEVRKIHSYNDLRKLAKLHFCSSSSSSIELAYRKSGTSILLGFYMKRLLSVFCVILDQTSLASVNRELPYLFNCWKPFSICALAFHVSYKGGAQARARRSRRGGARENTNHQSR